MLQRTLLPAAVAAGLLALTACSLPFTGSASPAAQPAAPSMVDRLVAHEAQGLGSVVTDQNGFTLYRFEKDSIAPPASNCAAQCAITWPPALVSGAPLSVSGVDQSLIGTITRADGVTQLTVSGHPVYRYQQDQAPGDVRGQGVGQTWFALTPTGEKAAAASTGAKSYLTEDGGTPAPSVPRSGDAAAGSGAGAGTGGSSSGADTGSGEAPVWGSGY